MCEEMDKVKHRVQKNIYYSFFHSLSTLLLPSPLSLSLRTMIIVSDGVQEGFVLCSLNNMLLLRYYW